MKRIGILGGTFNPLHIGHLAMAEAAQDRMELDKVIFVPCAQPPHKKIRSLASAEDRMAMVRLSIAADPGFDISDFEVKKGGKSYSIDTARHFREVFGPDVALFFIIGGDSAAQLSSWKKINELLGLVSFVVINRPGHDGCARDIPHYSVIMPGIDVASSYIRRRIHQGKSIKYLVPEEVFRYLQDHQIY